MPRRKMQAPESMVMHIIYRRADLPFLTGAYLEIILGDKLGMEGQELVNIKITDIYKTWRKKLITVYSFPFVFTISTPFF